MASRDASALLAPAGVGRAPVALSCLCCSACACLLPSSALCPGGFRPSAPPRSERRRRDRAWERGSATTRSRVRSLPVGQLPERFLFVQAQCPRGARALWSRAARGRDGRPGRCTAGERGRWPVGLCPGAWGRASSRGRVRAGPYGMRASSRGSRGQV